MYTESEGIILRQTKTANGRRMIEVFSKNYGKIGCGTSINEGGKNKSALALRPFTHGKYELFKNGDNFNISSAETIDSFFSIGEDVDKYMYACYVLELTDKVVLEGQPFAAGFSLLLEFLKVLEDRKKSYKTLVIAYQTKLLDLLGLKASDGLSADSLNLKINADIIQMLRYLEDHKLSDLRGIALTDENAAVLSNILKVYFSHHLEVSDLKSEKLIV